MIKTELEEKLKVLQQLYKSDFLQPFPYQDCRQILAETEENLEDFIPSLDFYFSEVAGYCSWGKRIITWSKREIEEAKKSLRDSFFQKFLKFSKLKSKISEKETPKLYSQLLIFDLMRLTLLDILAELETEKKAAKDKLPELSLVG